jgi:catechol 2,3-dioxygenase-like lactoylglutathione lyase family enzyme
MGLTPDGLQREKPNAMLHHISFGVADIHRAAAFYDAALAALGYERVWSDVKEGHANAAIGYGAAGGGDKFALKLRAGQAVLPAAGFHLAFAAPSCSAVDAFYAAAMQHGGQDNGAPGLRPDYGQNYYAAFVVDPDGHHIEAVTRETA